VPDIVTIAKPLAAGLPLGAFIAKEKFASALSPGKHGTTFGGGPLTTRTALEYLSIIEDDGLLERVTRVGAYMHSAFLGLKDKFPPLVKEARGRGMIQALELTVPGRPIVDAALQEGVLLNVTQETTLRFLPPFLLEEKHVDKAIRVLKKLLGKVKAAPAEAAASA
jgi:acetylornithine/succinyldiaminopimelate/putrescine aminotransferase